jgi:hypothetical protein
VVGHVTVQAPSSPAPAASAPVQPEALKAAALVLVDAALRVVEGDPHQFGKRPCDSCRTISRLLGRAFGCSKLNGDGGRVE